MDTLLYWLARSVLGFLQLLPLRWVARLGRIGGELFYWLDARHRAVAIRNLTFCFGSTKNPSELRALARENFRRIGENFASAARTAFMSGDELKPYLSFVGAEKVLAYQYDHGPQSRVIAIGHFGNFELYARFGDFVPIFKPAATYRGLDHPALNRLLQSLRARSGCRFFERRTEANALKAAMKETGLLLGLLADQHAGDRGLCLSFFGRECSTSAAPAVFALRYECPLHTAICYRTGLAQWRIEVGDEIPTRENGQARSAAAITQDINNAFEAAIRRDPANWFWVHNRWKPIRRPRNLRRVHEDSAQSAVRDAPEAVLRMPQPETSSKARAAR
jgi:lauroyl/myristoyl acyltransferase